jgi:hypothetical protein
MDIIKDVDKELKASEDSGKMDLDDIVVNPYERQGPKPPIVRSKPKVHTDQLSD